MVSKRNTFNIKINLACYVLPILVVVVASVVIRPVVVDVVVAVVDVADCTIVVVEIDMYEYW